MSHDPDPRAALLAAAQAAYDDAGLRGLCAEGRWECALDAMRRLELAPPLLPSQEIARRFGAIDIHLFDQLLRGRLDACRRVLDAGCGAGRNLVYLLQAGYHVYGVDVDVDVLPTARASARSLAPRGRHGFAAAALDALPLATASMDAVLASAVLHFARDEAHFRRMLDELWRVLRPGGVLFARLAASIAVEPRILPLGGGRYRLPDGTERFLVSEAALLAETARLGGELLDPLKATYVQGQRSMATWVLRRPAPPAHACAASASPSASR